MSGVERLGEAFGSCRAAGRAAFIGYMTCGYPTLASSVALMHSLERGGADVIEVGVPFSDPLADGATIQHANTVALGHRGEGGPAVTLSWCLAQVAAARAGGLRVPVVLMGYYNPILAYGEGAAVQAAAASGVDGLIVVDLPPDESGGLREACVAAGVSLVPLAAPTSSAERLSLVSGSADSFVYCVSLTGVTGSRGVDAASVGAFVERVRGVCSLPLAVGFGIRTRSDVEAIGKVADGVVVGSAIIRAIEEGWKASGGDVGGMCAHVSAFVRELSGRGSTSAAD